MKKILFLLLSIAGYGQTSTGQEQSFPYGIVNESLQTITTPTYIGTFGTDGTQGKIPSAYIAKTADVADSLATKENVANKATTFGTVNNTLYPTVQAVNEFAVAKVVNTKSTTPIVGGALNARMCVSNGMLYVTEYTNNKIGVFSLENPMSPTKIYEFTVGSAPRHVLVNGRNLFVACHDANTVEVWDIQNPESAYKIGTINTGLQPKMFQLLGEYLYVVCFGTSKLEKYKITMPDSSLSTFSYYKVSDVSVGLNPLAVSYNGDGLIAVCGNGDNVIKILSTDDLNVASSATFGGAGHGTCSWFNKTQLLVTDWTTESLLSIDYSNLSSPVLSSSITVSENPEQIEIIGNKAYIPSLRIATSPSYLDFIDLSDAKLPVKTKSETLTVNAAGFTATYTDGVNNYIYVDGHEAPFNIDAIKIELGDTHRQENTMRDIAYVNRLGVANLSTTTVDESKKYTNNSNPYTVSGIDNVLRLESGTTTLPNPNSVRDGKIVVISNVSNSGNVTVVNPFFGFSSLVLYPYESISVQSSKNGATYKWDAVGGRRNLPNIFDNGNIGIGTVNPTSYLNYRFLSVNGSDGAVLQLRKGDVTFGEVGGDGTFVNFDTFGGAYSKFSISGTEKLKIEAALITASVPVFAPTAAPGTNTTQIATTAFVQANSVSLSANNTFTGENTFSNYTIFGAPATLKNYTVATLPEGNQGDVAYVTDALTPTYLTAVVGGGSVVCPVFYNGTTWVSH